MNFWFSLTALVRFTRPHTIVGTTITTIALFIVTSGQVPDLSLNSALVLLFALVACLSANVFIVGLNQIFDIEVDKINKPYLPLAAGHFSLRTGWVIVTFTGGLSVLVSVTQSLFLLFTVLTGMLIGVAYSIPQLRLKQYPVLASLSIMAVRGVIGNVGLFLHFEEVLKSTSDVGHIILFLTLFIFVYSGVIAIFKDIPDQEGDYTYGIKTFTVTFGKGKVFAIANSILVVNYVLTAILVLLMPDNWNEGVIALFHLGAALFFLFRSRYVSLDSGKSIWSYYQQIWKLFYVEYLIIGLAVLL